MFCPVCGTLSFPTENEAKKCKQWIRCTNYACDGGNGEPYEGPLSGKDGKGAEFIDPETGVVINLAEAVTKTTSKIRDDRTRGEDKARGILYEDSYICPKCDCKKIFVWMQQTRSSDEPETKMCTCSECGHKFREYQ